jgi:P-type Mg2+ transporter
VIRTRRVPFLRSRPGAVLASASIGCVVIGSIIPFSPLAGWLGFTSLPSLYFLALGVMVAVYLALAEVAKDLFYRSVKPDKPVSIPLAIAQRRVHRLQTNWWARRPVISRS